MYVRLHACLLDDLHLQRDSAGTYFNKFLELVCTVGLIIPDVFHWQPPLTILAATVLAVESVVFVGVHVKYREVAPMILSAVLGLLMVFIAYGRMVLQPIF